MEFPNVRINSISLKNIKSVASGNIEFNVAEQLRIGKSSIMGIYGQNGSGKTVVIESLSILKVIMSGRQIPKRYLEIITFGEDRSSIEIEFTVIRDANLDCKVVYKCDLEQRINPNEPETSNGIDENGEPSSILVISSESLKVSGIVDGVMYPSQYIAQTDEKQKLIRPRQKCKLLFGDDEKSFGSLELHKLLAFYSSRSFLFSNIVINAIQHPHISGFAELIITLRYFASAKLFVVGGEIQREIPLPVNFIKKDTDSSTIGHIPFSLESKAIIPRSDLSVVEAVIPPMNQVLSSMIPGLSIKHKAQKATLDEKDDNYEVELFATRKQNYAFPLRHESLGIKKIISFLSLLIATYNDPSYVLAVDEFDSSVFEFLLGELVSVLNDSGKGQLIFTSHNLRPLEMLGDVSISFTTTDPENRYMKMKKKATNNLRDMYFRALALGGGDYEMYNSESKNALAYAFRQAGWNE